MALKVGIAGTVRADASAEKRGVRFGDGGHGVVVRRPAGERTGAAAPLPVSVIGRAWGFV